MNIPTVFFPWYLVTFVPGFLLLRENVVHDSCYCSVWKKFAVFGSRGITRLCNLGDHTENRRVVMSCYAAGILNWKTVGLGVVAYRRDAIGECERRGLDPVRRVDLGEDIAEVPGDRIIADYESITDLRIAQTASDQG